MKYSFSRFTRLNKWHIHSKSLNILYIFIDTRNYGSPGGTFITYDLFLITYYLLVSTYFLLLICYYLLLTYKAVVIEKVVALVVEKLLLLK